jgi:hypothetical protein
MRSMMMLALAGACIALPALANEANTRILTMTDASRRDLFGRYLAQTGEACDRVAVASYDGSSGDIAGWSIACADGHTYSVGINPDAKGSTNILTCGELATFGGRCFPNR